LQVNGTISALPATLSNQVVVKSQLDLKGDVFKVGTPANDQIGVWTGNGTLEGEPNFTYSSGILQNKATNSSFSLWNGGNRFIMSSAGRSISFYNGAWSNTLVLESPVTTEDRTVTIPHKTGTVALTSDLSNQIEVGANSNVLDTWMNNEVIFTASCTITVPATLPTNFNFNWLTLAGVTVTWAITAPHTWLFGTPANATEKTYGRMVKRNSGNSIIMLD
jgi:hypothetical protein